MNRNSYRILAFVMIALMLMSVPVAAAPQSSGLGSFFSWLGSLFSGSPTGAVIGAVCAEDRSCDVVSNAEYCDRASGTCAAQAPFPSVVVRRSGFSDLNYDPGTQTWGVLFGRASLELMNDGANDWVISVSAGGLYIASATFPSPGLTTLTIRPGETWRLQTYQSGLVQVTSGTAIIGSNYDGNRYNTVGLVQSSTTPCGSNPPTISNYNVQPAPPTAGSQITLTVFVNDLDNLAPCAGGQTFNAVAQIFSQPPGSRATLGIAPPPSTTSFAWSLVDSIAGTYVFEVTVTDSTGLRTTQQISFDVVASSSYYPEVQVFAGDFSTMGATLYQEDPVTFSINGRIYSRNSVDIFNNGPSPTSVWTATGPDLTPVMITLRPGDHLMFLLSSDGSGTGQIRLGDGTSAGTLPLRGPINFQPGSGCSPTQTPETSCNDGTDNDCNGMTDCSDAACAATAECGTRPTLMVMPSSGAYETEVTFSAAGLIPGEAYLLEVNGNAIGDMLASTFGDATFRDRVDPARWGSGMVRIVLRNRQGIEIASTSFQIEGTAGCTSNAQCGSGTVCDTASGSCVNSVSTVMSGAIASGKTAVWAYTASGWTGRTLVGVIHALFGNVKGSSVGYFAKAGGRWNSETEASLAGGQIDVCGNGMADPAEQCGEPGLMSCSAGSSCQGCQCVPSADSCGNGRVDASEQCDLSDPISSCQPGAYCSTSCACVPSTSSCGDRIVQPPEECDDGNTNPLDGCDNCRRSTGGCRSDMDCPATLPSCNIETGTCESRTSGCPAGYTSCGTSCVDTNTDRANCGGCGRSCAATETCSGGVCTSGTTPSCDDRNPCTTDRFDGISCIYAPVADGTPCPLGTSSGTCQRGTCA